MIENLKVGDLIFFYGRDTVSRTISFWTWGGPSHVGIVASDDGIGVPNATGQLVLFESTTMCPTPCLVQQKPTHGIQVQNIQDRIAQYGTAPVYLKLREECAFSPTEVNKFHVFAKRMVGTVDYDMPAAIRSGTNIVKYLVQPNINTLFCSATVARLLMLMNKMNWANPEIFTPGGLKHLLLRTAVYEEFK